MIGYKVVYLRYSYLTILKMLTRRFSEYQNKNKNIQSKFRVFVKFRSILGEIIFFVFVASVINYSRNVNIRKTSSC